MPSGQVDSAVETPAMGLPVLAESAHRSVVELHRGPKRLADGNEPNPKRGRAPDYRDDDARLEQAVLVDSSVAVIVASEAVTAPPSLALKAKNIPAAAEAPRGSTKQALCEPENSASKLRHAPSERASDTRLTEDPSERDSDKRCRSVSQLQNVFSERASGPPSSDLSYLSPSSGGNSSGSSGGNSSSSSGISSTRSSGSGSNSGTMSNSSSDGINSSSSSSSSNRSSSSGGAGGSQSAGAPRSTNMSFRPRYSDSSSSHVCNSAGQGESGNNRGDDTSFRRAGRDDSHRNSGSSHQARGWEREREREREREHDRDRDREHDRDRERERSRGRSSSAAPKTTRWDDVNNSPHCAQVLSNPDQAYASSVQKTFSRVLADDAPHEPYRRRRGEKKWNDSLYKQYW